jgi:hypothetical protein
MTSIGGCDVRRRAVAVSDLTSGNFYCSRHSCLIKHLMYTSLLIYITFVIDPIRSGTSDASWSFLAADDVNRVSVGQWIMVAFGWRGAEGRQWEVQGKRCAVPLIHYSR